MPCSTSFRSPAPPSPHAASAITRRTHHAFLFRRRPRRPPPPSPPHLPPLRFHSPSLPIMYPFVFLLPPAALARIHPARALSTLFPLSSLSCTSFLHSCPSLSCCCCCRSIYTHSTDRNLYNNDMSLSDFICSQAQREKQRPKSILTFNLRNSVTFKANPVRPARCVCLLIYPLYLDANPAVACWPRFENSTCTRFARLAAVRAAMATVRAQAQRRIKPFVSAQRCRSLVLVRLCPHLWRQWPPDHCAIGVAGWLGV